MAKYHINKNGEAAPCKAHSRSCPLGGEDEHYDTATEAQQAFEQKMSAELLPEGKSKKDLGLRDLNNLAKVSSDSSVIDEAIARGSDRTFKNLARNKAVNEDQLVEIYDKTDSQTVRDELVAHPNFPVRKMSQDEFTNVVKSSDSPWGKRARSLMSSNDITDEHIEGIQNMPRSRWAPAINVSDALANPNNKLSQEKLVELGETSWTSLGPAMRSGRYPADRMKNLPKNLVYWGNVDQATNPEYLNGYGEWSIKNHETDKENAEYIANRVANNENTPAKTLDSLASKNMSVVEVYRNKNTAPETKERLVRDHPKVAQAAKIDKLEKETGGLRKAITATGDHNDRTSYPYGRNRGYSITTVQLDPKKIKKLGMNRSDVMEVMGARGYNAGVSYNEETGIFSASLDSTG